MKIKRIISLLLAVLMLSGAFAVTAYAEDETVKYEYTKNTTNATPTIDYIKGVTIPKEEEEVSVSVDTKEKKLLFAFPKASFPSAHLRFGITPS